MVCTKASAFKYVFLYTENNIGKREEVKTEVLPSQQKVEDSRLMQLRSKSLNWQFLSMHSKDHRCPNSHFPWSTSLSNIRLSDQGKGFGQGGRVLLTRDCEFALGVKPGTGSW